MPSTSPTTRALFTGLAPAGALKAVGGSYGGKLQRGVSAGEGGEFHRRIRSIAQDFPQHGIGEGIRPDAAGRGDEQGAVDVEDDGAEPGRGGLRLKGGKQEMEGGRCEMGGENLIRRQVFGNAGGLAG